MINWLALLIVSLLYFVFCCWVIFDGFKVVFLLFFKSLLAIASFFRNRIIIKLFKINILHFLHFIVLGLSENIWIRFNWRLICHVIQINVFVLWGASRLETFIHLIRTLKRKHILSLLLPLPFSFFLIFIWFDKIKTSLFFFFNSKLSFMLFN